MYALRDLLREAAMKEEINPRNWVFLYLDSSIAKTIDILHSITIWHIFLAPITLRNREKFLRAKMHLHRELSKPKNRCLMYVHKEYISTIGFFVLNRYPVAKFVAIKLLVAVSIGQDIKKRWERGVEIQAEAPDTSTLLEYAPA
jgi:hypothetical protein